MIMPGLPFGLPDGPLDLVYHETRFSSTNLSTYSYTDVSIGGAGAGRLVIVAATGVTATGSALFFGNATIGGITATKVVESNLNTGLPVAIFAAVVPTGTSATVAVGFTSTAGSNSVSVFTLSKYRSATAQSSFTAQNIVSNGPVTGSLASSIGSAVVAVVCAGATSGSIDWSSPMIEVVDTPVENRPRSAAMALANGPLTITATPTDGNNTNGCAASWR